MKRFIFLFLVIAQFLLMGCETKKKLDPKFDPALYEQIDVNFYKGKQDGQIYIRTGMLQPVKDSASRVVYYYKLIPEIDIASFKRLKHGGYYAKDNNHVYTWDIDVTGENIVVLEGAKAASFQSIAYRWGKDSSAVYFENKKIPGLNPSELSFVCFEEEDTAMIYVDYMRDNDQLFYHETEVKVPNGIDITQISCKEDLLGNPFLSVGENLYVIRNGVMVKYQ